MRKDHTRTNSGASEPLWDAVGPDSSTEARNNAMLACKERLRAGCRAHALPQDIVAISERCIDLWDQAGRPASFCEPFFNGSLDDNTAAVRWLKVLFLGAEAKWEAQAQTADLALGHVDKVWRGPFVGRKALALAHRGALDLAIATLKTALCDIADTPSLHLILAQLELQQHGAVAAAHALLAMSDNQLAAPLVYSEACAKAAQLLLVIAQAEPPILTPLERQEQVELLRILALPQMAHDDLSHARLIARTFEQPRLLTLSALILLNGGAADAQLGGALLAQCQTALRIDADPPRLLAASRLAHQDFDGALTALLDARAKNPFDVELHVMVQTVAERLGRLDIAVAAARSAMRLKPNTMRFADDYQRLKHFVDDQDHSAEKGLPSQSVGSKASP